MERVTGFFYKAKQTLAVFLAVMLVCNTCLLPLVWAADNEAKEIDVVDTMTNYDPKLRIGKIIWKNIQDDQAKGREVDWEKINKKVFRKSIMTHLAVDTGADWIILQSNSRQAVLEDARHRPGGKIAETRGIMKLREQLMSLHSRYLQLLSSSDFEAAERLKISEIQPLRTQLNLAIGSTP